MHPDAAGEAFERQGQLPQLRDRLAVAWVGHHLADLRLLLARLEQAERLVLYHRDQLGEPVAQAIGQVEHAADVAHHRLRGHGAEGGDLAHRIGAVALAHILDDLVAVILAEVDVEVGHRDPLGVQEALEQQRVFERVQIGDLERIGDQRAGPEPRPGPTGTPLFLAQRMKSATIRK